MQHPHDGHETLWDPSRTIQRNRSLRTRPGVGVVEQLERDYYAAVSRYTTSAFMRLKLAQVLTRAVRPHLFESLSEARAFHEARDGHQ